MNIKKKILIGVAVLAVAGGLYGYKEYNRKNKDLANVRADIKIHDNDLILAFEKNEADANRNLLDKVIQVDGAVKEVIKDENGYFTVVLGKDAEKSSVRCSMDTVHQQDAEKVVQGKTISIKGICTGFNADELVGSDVILNRCVINTNK